MNGHFRATLYTRAASQGVRVPDDPTTRRPTIREVARLAGVSHQTVSRYLRLDSSISESRRERIGQAIAQLDYRPSMVARAMRVRRTGRLALICPTGSATSAGDLLRGAMSAAQPAGYNVEMITLAGRAADRTQQVLELTDSRLFEGIASLTPLELPQSRIGSTPIVVLPEYDDQMRSIGQVADAEETFAIIRRLVELGHRRFLHLAGDNDFASARNRRRAYLAAIAEHGVESFAVVDCGWRAEPAQRAIHALPADSGVTAVIAANDLLATGAIRAATERGWEVPGDLSVTGWDSNALGAAMLPSLTSVEVDYHGLGRSALRSLITRLRGEGPQPDEPSLTKVVWRESTGPARPVTR